MRRLPIYFLIDVSESMVGEPVKQVQEGMRAIVQELRTDPYALETAFLSIVCFAGKAKSLSPLEEICTFYPPTEFPIGGGTSIGAGLKYLMHDFETNIQKTTAEVKGDWKPIIFLFTDGNPTDDYSSVFKLWNDKFRHGVNLVAVAVGDNVNFQILGQITDNVLRLKDASSESFKAFFKWVTASIKTSSVSVSEKGNDDLNLAKPDGINLEKVDLKKSCKVDENYVVLHAKCAKTKRDYLVKFAKRLEEVTGEKSKFGEEVIFDVPSDKFKIVGAYPIDGQSYQELSDNTGTPSINTKNLYGQTNCPCCEGRYGIVFCQCGNIFCADFDGLTNCPWCGFQGKLSFMDGNSEGMNVNRAKG